MHNQQLIPTQYNKLIFALLLFFASSSLLVPQKSFADSSPYTHKLDGETRKGFFYTLEFLFGINTADAEFFTARSHSSENGYFYRGDKYGEIKGLGRSPIICMNIKLGGGVTERVLLYATLPDWCSAGPGDFRLFGLTYFFRKSWPSYFIDFSLMGTNQYTFRYNYNDVTYESDRHQKEYTPSYDDGKSASPSFATEAIIHPQYVPAMSFAFGKEFANRLRMSLELRTSFNPTLSYYPDKDNYQAETNVKFDNIFSAYYYVGYAHY